MRQIDYNELTKKLTEKPKSSFEKDPRILTLTKPNKNGNIGAIIRFLPPHPAEDMPRVKVVRHYWTENVNGQNVSLSFEPCPSSIGEKCPICAKHWELWRGGQKDVKTYKPSESYYVNVLVVSCPMEPELEGQVKIMKLQRAMWMKIEGVLNPTDGVTTALQPFSYTEGNNFKLIGTPTTYPKADGSEGHSFDWIKNSKFEDNKTRINLKGKELTDAEIEELDTKLYELLPFVAEEKIATPEIIASVCEKKLGYNPFGGSVGTLEPKAKPAAKKESLIEETDDSEIELLKPETKTEPKAKPAAKPAASSEDADVDTMIEELF